MKPFTVQINDKNGIQFRKYTKDTFQMLFDTSPSAANFEMIIVLEGLVFTAIRMHYMVTKKEKDYDKFISNKKRGTFYNAIEKLYKLGIIDLSLKDKLHTYRELRNEIAHDLFQLKSVYTEGTPKFKDYPHTTALKNLFDTGLDSFNLLGEIITPGIPNQEEFLKRFSGYYKKD